MSSRSSTQAQAFQQEVAAHPHDDAPRLVYADWLEEQGDPLAEFIRIQCELDEMRRGPLEDLPRYNELEARELQLVRQYFKSWSRDVRRYASQWRFSRGMASHLVLDASRFMGDSEAIFRSFPIQSIGLENAQDQLLELAGVPYLRQLRCLGFPRGVGMKDDLTHRHSYYPTPFEVRQTDLSRNRAQNAEKLREFLMVANLDELRSLRLPENFIGNEGAQMLATCPRVSQLHSLDLRVNELTTAGVATLAQSPHLESLKELRLAGCQNPRSGTNTPGEFGRLIPILASRLKSLELAQCSLDNNTFAAAGRVATYPLLERLGLAGCHGPGFSNSMLIAGLRILDVSSCYVEDRSFAILLMDKKLASLEELRLDNNFMWKKAGQIIANAPWPRLRKLSINGHGRSGYADPAYFTEHGFQALCQTEQFNHLSWLSLQRQNIGDASVSHLLDAPFLEQLYYLNLSLNTITDEGALQLAKHGPWARLASLNLRRNPIGTTAKQALQKAFGYRVLF